eukprot:10340205-Karenia_brevis.AAC.1
MSARLVVILSVCDGSTPPTPDLVLPPVMVRYLSCISSSAKGGPGAFKTSLKPSLRPDPLRSWSSHWTLSIVTG